MSRVAGAERSDAPGIRGSFPSITGASPMLCPSRPSGAEGGQSELKTCIVGHNALHLRLEMRWSGKLHLLPRCFARAAGLPRLNPFEAASMTNPYSSPAPSAPLRPPRSSISVLKAIAVAAGCGLGGGLFGAGLGFALGRFAPGYYRSLFRNGDRPGFDPEAVGLGLGATQGVVVGLVVGLVIVFMLAWFNSRRGVSSKR